MLSLYKLQSKVFFKGPTLIFLVVMSFIYLLIFGSIVKYSGLDVEAQETLILVVFGSVAAISLLNVSLNSFGFSFFDMKNSVLIKRIGSTKLTKTDVILAFIFWGITIAFMSIVIMILIMLFLGNAIGYFPDFKLGSINWPGLIVGTFIGSAATFCVALFLISISPSTQIYQVYSTIYFFFFAAFGGLFSPVSNPEWMNVIGWFSPISWTADFLTASAQGANVFHLGGYALPSFSDGQATQIDVSAAKATLDLMMPIVYGALFLGVTVKTFKWDS